MKWGRAAGLVAGGVALLWILSSVGLDVILRDVMRAGVALPAAIVVHAMQLLLSEHAWRAALGGAGPSWPRLLRIRWIREGVNTMLPVAQIGGPVVGTRMLVQTGVPPKLAVAGTILDLTLEAAAQLVVTLAAVVLLMLLREGDRAWFGWIEGGVGAAVLGVCGLVMAQCFGALRLVEAVLQRAVSRWPGTAGWSLAGLHATVMQRGADRGAMLTGLLTHCVGWSLGAVEVWILLRALGHGIGLGQAFVIESLAMAARSAAFAVPGAVGVQEGGFVLVCSLFGIDAETALALSVLKRLRELAVGIGALLAWQLVRERPKTSAAP